jgi:hypothetical protein
VLLFTKMGENGNEACSVAHRGIDVAEEPHSACGQPFQTLVGAGTWCSGLSPELSWGSNGGKEMRPVWCGRGEGKKGLAVWAGAGLNASGGEGLEGDMPCCKRWRAPVCGAQ